MKTLLQSIFTISLLILGALNIQAQPPAEGKQGPPPKPGLVFADDDATSITFTADVMAIIDNKCYGCHSPNSRNEKAKEKLIWKDLQNLDPIDAVGVMEEMLEVLDEGSMPPEKMLERFPDKKLTDGEVATLKAWVESVQTKLMDE